MFPSHPNDEPIIAVGSPAWLGHVLDGNVQFSADAPIQPRLYANVAAPNAGRLHGALFLGGVYTDVASFDPVIALPYNEYVESTAEPTFAANGWYPAVPFQVRSSATVSNSAETLVTLLGQFNSDADTERVFGQMTFDTFFSNSSDTEPATISHVDGVLHESTGLATLKVEAEDPSGVLRVVIAYTQGDGQWKSRDLAYSAAMLKWTGNISATVGTMYFVQAVDGAGNVATSDNKGEYYPLAAPIPLARGQYPTSLYLPMLRKGGNAMQ